MLLQCETCLEKCSSLAKIPCGFFFEKNEKGDLIFVQPLDETGFRNICLKCLFNSKEKTP
jgi:hypothetical protein